MKCEQETKTRKVFSNSNSKSSCLKNAVKNFSIGINVCLRFNIHSPPYFKISIFIVYILGCFVFSFIVVNALVTIFKKRLFINLKHFGSWFNFRLLVHEQTSNKYKIKLQYFTYGVCKLL